MGKEDSGFNLPRKRWLAGETFVEHAPEGVDVGAAIDVLGSDLLWGDVVDRPYILPCLGQSARRARVLGYPEIGEVDMVRLVISPALDQDVAGLHVAMNKAFTVGCVKRAANLRDQRQRLGRSEPALSVQHGAQVSALDVAHRDVQQVIRGARVEDRQQVGVIEGSRDSRLLSGTAFGSVIVFRELRSKHLESNSGPRLDSPFVDQIHPTIGDHTLQAIAA